MNAKERIEQGMVKNKNYEKLLSWIEEFRGLHIKNIGNTTPTKHILDSLKNIDTVYEAWIFMEFVSFLKAKNIPINLEFGKNPKCEFTYNQTVGSGLQVSKQIGSEVASTGVAITGAAIERGGLLGGLGVGVGFFVGPGLNALIAFVASEIWLIYIGGLIWSWDWLWGLAYFFVTGAGLVLATLPAMGSMLLIVKVLDTSQKTIDSNDKKMDFNIGTKCWQDNCEEFETMIKMLIQNLGMLKVGAERLLMVKGGETPTGNHLPLTDIHRFMIRNDARILHLSISVHTLFEWNRVLTKNFCCELLTQNYKHSDNVAKNDVLVWEMNEKLRDARIRKAIDLFSVKI